MCGYPSRRGSNYQTCCVLVVLRGDEGEERMPIGADLAGRRGPPLQREGHGINEGGGREGSTFPPLLSEETWWKARVRFLGLDQKFFGFIKPRLAFFAYQNKTTNKMEMHTRTRAHAQTYTRIVIYFPKILLRSETQAQACNPALPPTLLLPDCP